MRCSQIAKQMMISIDENMNMTFICYSAQDDVYLEVKVNENKLKTYDKAIEASHIVLVDIHMFVSLVKKLIHCQSATCFSLLQSGFTVFLSMTQTIKNNIVEHRLATTLGYKVRINRQLGGVILNKATIRLLSATVSHKMEDQIEITWSEDNALTILSKSMYSTDQKGSRITIQNVEKYKQAYIPPADVLECSSWRAKPLFNIWNASTSSVLLNFSTEGSLILHGRFNCATFIYIQNKRRVV